MKAVFETLKNGKNSTAVWANVATKEICPANRNSFGYNAEYHLGDAFYNKYGKDLKTTQGKSNPRKFYYSAKSMENLGFQLVLRGEAPLW